MKTPNGLKNIAVSNLQRCEELLCLRDNGYNEESISFLLGYIIETKAVMEKLDTIDSLEYYRNRMNHEIIESLRRSGIEYILFKNL